MLSDLIHSEHIIGLKQTTRALKNNSVKTVYVAKDADSMLLKPVVELCKKNRISIVEVSSMKELGEALNVEVDTAVAAELL